MSEYFSPYSEHIPFEEPEARDLDIKVDGERITARKGNTVVALFWERPEVDYVGITDGESSHILFNQDFAHWVGGVSLDAYHAEIVRNSERDSFKDLYGWRPRIVIDEYPNEQEVELWVRHKTADLDIPGAWEEDEDDGA